jgi:hypothetical protein
LTSLKARIEALERAAAARDLAFRGPLDFDRRTEGSLDALARAPAPGIYLLIDAGCNVAHLGEVARDGIATMLVEN